jgi:ABC-type lipoprotein export system ATPase subunit
MCTARIATTYINQRRMLTTGNLSFRYQRGTAFSFPDISLTKGDQVALTGNSGSGKTTLLHLLCGILRAETGKVVINGTDIQQPGFDSTDRFRGKHIGLIFQKHFFIDGINMMENLLLAQELPGLQVDKSYLTSLLEELKITSLAGKHPAQLSQGELQRFSLARALANKPLLLLADEPTSSLDDDSCARFTSLLLNLSDKHETTLLIATHDARLKKEFKTVISL